MFNYMNSCNLPGLYSHFKYERSRNLPSPPKEIKLSKYQLIKGNFWTTISSNKPPSSSTHCGSTNVTCKKTKSFTQRCELYARQDFTCHTWTSPSRLPALKKIQVVIHVLAYLRGKKPLVLTSNGQVTEEEPAADQGLFGVARGFVHDVQVRRVEAQGSGREPIRHKVHPQQLNRNQSFRKTQGSSQEDTTKKPTSYKLILVHVCNV